MKRSRRIREGWRRAWLSSDSFAPYVAGYTAAMLEAAYRGLQPNTADSIQRAAEASFERVYIHRRGLDEDSRLRAEAVERFLSMPREDSPE